MYSKIYSAVNIGLDSKLVEVETDLKDGFPRFDILGLGDKAIEEAKGRVRSAIINSNFSFPARKKIIVNLAPADIKKEGFGSRENAGGGARSVTIRRITN